MHELGLLKTMLRTADAALEGQLAENERIKKIVLEVGELTGAVPEYLQDAYGPLVKGTKYEGSELETIYVPGTVRCEDCGEEFAARAAGFKCPKCGCLNLHLIRGKGLDIKEIVVETDD